MRYPDQATLGNAIRQLRASRDISQEGLAHEAGMHRTYLGGIERGERNPSYRNLVRIAASLDVRLSELIGLAERLAAE